MNGIRNALSRAERSITTLGNAISVADRGRLIFWPIVLVFTTYAYFANAVGFGQAATRLALSLSLVEHSWVAIDLLAEHTNDKAQVGAHYYVDKAPGVSLLALPVVAAALPLLASGDPPTWFDGDTPTARFVLLGYIVGIFVSIVPAVLAVAMVFQTAISVGSGPAGALFAAISVALGTPMWGWATTLYGHATSASFLFLALGLVIRLETLQYRQARWLSKLITAGAAGMLLGGAVVVEFTAAGAALFIAFYAVARVLRTTGGRRGTALIATALVALF